jgi:hypothetical protein
MGRENSITTGAAIPKRSMVSTGVRTIKPTQKDTFVRVVKVYPETGKIDYEKTVNNYNKSVASMESTSSQSPTNTARTGSAFAKDLSQTRLPIVNEWVKLEEAPDYTAGTRNGQYNRITVYSTSPTISQLNLVDNRVPQQETYGSLNPDSINNSLTTNNYVVNNIGI